jgi:hypothetical protein
LLSEEAAKQVAHATGLSKTTRLLICLAVGDEPKSVGELTETAARIGLPAAKAWNISGLLSASGGKAIRTPQGWELSGAGKQAVEALAGPLGTASPPKPAISLRAHITAIADPHTREFVEEAISCLEHKLHRAAVVLSWIGAVSLLYDYVLKHELASFNPEATKRDAKWKTAKTRDDLARMKEFDFLQILESISVIGKNTKAELEGCLKLRNACGHPSSLSIGEHRVASHIEILVLNVFGKF